MALAALFSLPPAPGREVREAACALRDLLKGCWKQVLTLQSIPKRDYHKNKKEIVHKVKQIVPSAL